MNSAIERLQRQASAIRRLADIMHEHGGTPMTLLNRNPVLGGARVRFEGDKECLDACEAFVRTQSWQYHRMRSLGAPRSQMTVNFTVTPEELQRALAPISNTERRALND